MEQGLALWEVRHLASAALPPFWLLQFLGAQLRKEEALLYCVRLSVEVAVYRLPGTPERGCRIQLTVSFGEWEASFSEP